MQAFKEACGIVHRMRVEDEPVFDGSYRAAGSPINEPKGVQKLRSSFRVGGSGEKVTLRLGARRGDACNIIAT